MNTTQKHAKLLALGRLCLFVIIFCSLFLTLESIFFSDDQIHPTWAYVADPDHKPIDILFVGNSHTYTSIDAELISKATGLNIRGLTCSSINGAIVEASINAFLNYEVPKVVVLEMCPFAIDTYEAMRNERLGIVLENFDGIPDTIVRWKALAKVAPLEDIPAGVFQLLRNTMMWTRWNNPPSNSGFDAYGTSRQYQVNYNTNFNPTDLAAYYSAPDDIGNISMHSVNENSLNNIVKLSEKYGFDIWIYNAPIDSQSKLYATTLSYVESLKETHPCIKYIDNSMLYLNEIGIKKTDYYDPTHLNPNGMEKTSLWLGKLIAERFHTDFNTDNLLLYKNTNVTLLQDGSYRYEINTFDHGEYCFAYQINGKQYNTGFSDKNWVNTSAISLKEMSKFDVYIRKPTSDHTEDYDRMYRFLPYTIESYTASFKENTVSIKNDSNFSDDLTFAWYVINTETGVINEYEYSTSNILHHTFEESGTYRIRAYTLQTTNQNRRGTSILIINYDEECNTLSIESSIDCVNLI